MPIYRIKFETTLMVEANSEDEAVSVAKENLLEEVKNDFSQIVKKEIITDVEQLSDSEKYSLPWLSKSIDDKYDLEVFEILGAGGRKNAIRERLR